MKVDTVLSSTVYEQLAEKMGNSHCGNQDQASSLLAHKEDHVWIWNRVEQELLMASTGDDGEVQVMELTECPRFRVEGIQVSRTGLWVAVWGIDGVTVVKMPSRCGVGGKIAGGKGKVFCRTVNILDSQDEEVQSVAWHPGSTLETHLVILTRNGRIMLHDVDEDESLVNELKISAVGKVATALGEVAVDLSFGGAGESENCWPLFVLYGNCDIYCVSASLGQEWEFEGPLEVMPQREDNYSGEASSLIVCNGIVALATVGGVIYHSIVLGGETTSLHTYERVELELGVVQSSAKSSTFDCPVRLTTDGRSARYIAYHRAGLHQVQLPMVALLRDAERAGVSLDIEHSASHVEHLICTRPTSSSDPAPVMGACFAYPPTTVLCLLSNNTITALPAPLFAHTAPSLVSDGPGLTSKDNQAPQFDSQLNAILARGSSQPILRCASATTLSPAETLELLSGTTATLRKEYLARLHVAREELIKRVDALVMKKKDQGVKLDKLETDRGKVREKAEMLSERYEDVRDKGLELASRMEVVLNRIQSKVPNLSDKELAMAREVTGLDRRIQSLDGSIQQLKEKEKYQRYQVEIGSKAEYRNGKDSRFDTIKEVLQTDSRSIANLVRTVNEMKKDLGI